MPPCAAFQRRQFLYTPSVLPCRCGTGHRIGCVTRMMQSTDSLDYAEEKQENRCNLRHLRIKQRKECISRCEVSGCKLRESNNAATHARR